MYVLYVKNILSVIELNEISVIQWGMLLVDGILDSGKATELLIVYKKASNEQSTPSPNNDLII